LDSKIAGLTKDMTDVELASLIEKVENSGKYTVTFLTAELDNDYFQGFLCGAEIRHKILTHQGDSLYVEYVGSIEALRLLVNSFFKVGVPVTDEQSLRNIVKV
jgi:hypothetical protein